MALITVLKRLAGISPNDVEAAATALREVEAELSAAVAAFDAANSSFGADLVAAMTAGKPEAVEANLEAKRKAVDRHTRAREAVAERLQRAQDAARADTLAERWDAAEKALQARREALVRLEQAAADFGAALVAAEVAARKAWDAMPVKPSDGPHYLGACR
ncbi:hypothetical protein [Arenimonas daejeonensis]|uniref:hypothetical protein n=1 Tax=Arenimonas daejeonensis TaxID=370777 RepID=UPI0011BE7E1B|nr:hypothetical protein [Arenimonas daejeonensis]